MQLILTAWWYGIETFIHLSGLCHLSLSLYVLPYFSPPLSLCLSIAIYRAFSFRFTVNVSQHFHFSKFLDSYAWSFPHLDHTRFSLFFSPSSFEYTYLYSSRLPLHSPLTKCSVDWCIMCACSMEIFWLNDKIHSLGIMCGNFFDFCHQLNVF